MSWIRDSGHMVIDGTLIISSVSQHFGSFISWITLKYPREIIGRNATESFFPKKSGIYSQWLLDDAGVFTFCRYYPAINLLAAVANNPDEQAQRTTALARHADKFVALTEFSKQLVESL
ncbi:hypothetical protein NIES4075_68610 [Tolypothrix sp. NIES-4075]|nr:hypothetical protein NIES4075_68610 [Tolypothrix sp. NIES-4075]